MLKLVLRNLSYYRRTNLAVVLGVGVAVAVLAGGRLGGGAGWGGLRGGVFSEGPGGPARCGGAGLRRGRALLGVPRPPLGGGARAAQRRGAAQPHPRRRTRRGRG